MKKVVTVMVYVCSLALLLSLGFWQVERARQKETLLSLASSKDKEPQLIQQAPPDWNTLNYQSVRLQGQWLPEQSFLLDNRVYEHQVGYELLTPLRLRDGSLVMVNRGWLPREGASAALARPSELATGVLYLPSRGFSIGDAITAGSEWPVVSLYLDLDAFSVRLQHALQPVVLVLDKADGNALIPIWKPVTFGPERHWGYAAQWFGLALVLMIFGVIWARKSRRR